MVKKNVSFLNLWHCAFQDYTLIYLASEGQLTKNVYSEDNWEALSRVKIQ